MKPLHCCSVGYVLASLFEVDNPTVMLAADVQVMSHPGPNS